MPPCRSSQTERIKTLVQNLMAIVTQFIGGFNDSHYAPSVLMLGGCLDEDDDRLENLVQAVMKVISMYRLSQQARVLFSQ